MADRVLDGVAVLQVGDEVVPVGLAVAVSQGPVVGAGDEPGGAADPEEGLEGPGLLARALGGRAAVDEEDRDDAGAGRDAGAGLDVAHGDRELEAAAARDFYCRGAGAERDGHGLGAGRAAPVGGAQDPGLRGRFDGLDDRRVVTPRDVDGQRLGPGRDERAEAHRRREDAPARRGRLGRRGVVAGAGLGGGVELAVGVVALAVGQRGAERHEEAGQVPDPGAIGRTSAAWAASSAAGPTRSSARAETRWSRTRAEVCTAPR